MNRKLKVAVILSGCGNRDGSEIRESILSLYCLNKMGAEVSCFAPDVDLKVVNHLTGEETGELRSVLTESARIARGKVQNFLELNSKSFDVLVIPGGFGVAKNLSTFASAGTNCEINTHLHKMVLEFHADKKPIGAICIAPAIIAKIFEPLGGVKITLGPDGDAAKAARAMKSTVLECPAWDVVVDPDNLIVSTPAYLHEGASLSDIGRGIEKLLNQMYLFCQ